MVFFSSSLFVLGLRTIRVHIFSPLLMRCPRSDSCRSFAVSILLQRSSLLLFWQTCFPLIVPVVLAQCNCVYAAPSHCLCSRCAVTILPIVNTSLLQRSGMSTVRLFNVKDNASKGKAYCYHQCTTVPICHCTMTQESETNDFLQFVCTHKSRKGL